MFKDLYNSICTSHSGCCSFSRTLCPNCRLQTVRANGFPDEWADQLEGLAYHVSGYIDPTEFAPVTEILRKMRKQLYAMWDLAGKALV